MELFGPELNAEPDTVITNDTMLKKGMAEQVQAHRTVANAIKRTVTRNSV